MSGFVPTAVQRRLGAVKDEKGHWLMMKKRRRYMESNQATKRKTVKTTATRMKKEKVNLKAKTTRNRVRSIF